MPRPWLLSPAVSDAAVVTATNTVGTLPVTNLLRAQPFYRWRTNDLDSEITIDFGAAAAVQVVFLGYVSTPGLWRVFGANSEAGLATPIYDSGVLDLEGGQGWFTWQGWARFHAWVFLPGALHHRWWRILVESTGAADSYIEAGRLALGVPYRPSRGHDFGFQPPSLVDESFKRRSLSGSPYVRRRGRWREASFQLSYLSAEELMLEAGRIERLRGTRGDVVMCLDDERPELRMEMTLHGYLKSIEPIVNVQQQLYRKRFELEEAELP